MNKEKFYENFIIPFALTFLIFLFLPGLKYYIFGQDSLPFFGQFTYSQDPLYPFNNDIGMVYFSLISEFVIHFFSSVVLSQRILIFIGTYISIAGFFDMIDVITHLPNKVRRITSKTVGTMFFLYNPFTLSVTWWHFDSWSLLILMSPIIISFLTATVYNKSSFRRFLITTVLTMIFAGGFLWGLYPFFLLVVAIFLAFPIYHIIKNIHNKTIFFSMVRRIIYIACFVGVATLWAIVPLYFYTFETIAGPLRGSYLLNFFQSESLTTTLPNVLSMTGFLWIYNVPNAYPWIHMFPAIQATAFLLLFFIPVTPIIFRKYRRILPLILVALFAILFSTGNNFPFGIINKNLLLLKGPFLFLINPYYWVMQYYVLFMALLLSLVFYHSMPKTKNKFNHAIKRNFRYLFDSFRLNYLKIIAVVLILFIIGTFFYPFATDQVYQENGSNIDAINLSNGLLELRSYLKATYISPDYYTLLIPTSSGPVSYLNYNNNSTFADSRGLISTIDPYPLIWINNNYLSASVENYLSSNDLHNIGDVMSYLHVRYVIFTNNHSNNSLMEDSPDGSHYNFSGIFNALKTSFGNPIKFGSYYVFFNPNAKPIFQVIENPVTTNSTLLQYLEFLGSINSSTLPKGQMSIVNNAIISNATFNNGRLSLVQPSFWGTYKFPTNQTVLMMSNGTFETPANVGFVSKNGVVSIKPIVETSLLSNLSSYSTNILMNNNHLFSNQISYNEVNNNISTPSSINISLKASDLPYNSKIYFIFQYGNVNVETQFMTPSYAGSPDVLAMAAYFTGKGAYASQNILLPAGSVGKIVSFSIMVFQNYSLRIVTRDKSPQFFASTTFYFGDDNYLDNQDYNISNFEPDYKFPTLYRIEFNSGRNFPPIINNFTITQLVPIKYILFENISSTPSVGNVIINTSIYGNYFISNISSKDASYLYFFGPPAGEWGAYVQGSSNALPISDKDNFSIIYQLPRGLYNSYLQVKYQSSVPLIFGISSTEVVVLLTLLIANFIKRIYISKRAEGKYRS